MRALARYCPQPMIAVWVVTLACLTAVASWAVSPPAAHLSSVGANTTALAVVLLALIVLAYKFRIHLNPALKLSMMTVPLYIAAVVLPPPLALTVAGLGIVVGEVLTQGDTGNLLSDVLTAAGRWVPIIYVASVVAHLPVTLIAHPTLFVVGAAVIMLAGDTLTVPLSIGPMIGERPHLIMGTVLREGGLAEVAQYLLGLLAALVVQREPWTLGLFVVPTALVYLAFRRAREMENTTRILLEGMADAVDMRDPYTGGHSRRVTRYTEGILRQMARPAAEADLIVAAARVHDIGKISVPDVVLKKPGPLTSAERVLMEQHAERGAYLLRRYPDFARGVAIVRHHHEAWDGSGYPDKLHGTDIPFGARVVAVADSFDAMTSDRPYRNGMSPQQAAQILRAGRNRQWDALVVDALLASVTEVLEHPAASHLQLVRGDDEVSAQA